MIEELIPRLEAAGLEPDLRELRDALWLAMHIAPGGMVLPGHEVTGGAPRSTARRSGDHRRGSLPEDLPALPADAGTRASAAELHAAGSAGSGRSLSAMEARSPAVPALRHQLALSRALRPLKRRIPSRTFWTIDEEATAVRAAEEGIWFPVFRNAPVRWLELELVVDVSASMAVWRRTLAELRILLDRLGAFRNIRESFVDSSGRTAEAAPLVRDRTGHLRDLTNPVGPNRSRAILLVTDGIGAAWRDGRMADLLRSWETAAPTAVVTVLPQRMWPGSGLRAVPGQLRTAAPGPGSMAIAARVRSAADRRASLSPISVMELSARWLAPWADLLAGSPGWRNAALLQAPAQATALAGEPQPRLLPDDSAAEIVRQFRASASPTAFQLACYLSAAGLNLPVMRLVQQVMLPKSDTVHLAEVFLSGLLLVLHNGNNLAPEEVVQYDFVPGVRHELNNYLVRDELLEIVRQTSSFVAERFGQPLDFSALLADPEGAPLPALGGDAPPLAYVSATVLAKLGGRYQVLAERLAAASSQYALSQDVAAGEKVRPAASQAKEGPSSPQTSASPRADAKPEGESVETPEPGKPPTIRRPKGSRTLRPYFFLSYARTPRRDPTDREDPDRWVYKLYKDLCDVILQLTDVSPDEVGFMDRESRLGVEWSPELVSALEKCRVFVPLYSRRYFESSYCGREWFAFARREVTLRARGLNAPSGVVPALWTRMDVRSIPAVAQSIQFDHSSLGERYSAEGFYGIMKLQNYRADYQRAVHRLAQRIVDIGDENPDPGDPAADPEIDFESLPSAFGPDSATRITGGQLRISLLAPDRSILPPGRSRDYYGATPMAWIPYWPEFVQPISEVSIDLARKCLDAKPLVDARQIAEWPGQPLPPTLVLIDPWVAQVPLFQRELHALNEIEESWVGVLVPWNSRDAELTRSESDLRPRLNEILGRKLAAVPRRTQMAADGIPTLEDFGQILPELTMTMLKRFRKGAPAHPPAGPVIERPRLRQADPEASNPHDS
jgi:FxsC-like protein